MTNKNDLVSTLVSETIRALRRRSGLTMQEFAFEMGLKGPSSVQRYESSSYKGGYLKHETATRMCKALVGRGDPAIEASEILDLIGASVQPSIAVISAAEIDKGEEKSLEALEVRLRPWKGGGLEYVGTWNIPNGIASKLTVSEGAVVILLSEQASSMSYLINKSDNIITRPGKYAMVDELVADGFSISTFTDRDIQSVGTKLALSMDVIGRVLYSMAGQIA